MCEQEVRNERRVALKVLVGVLLCVKGVPIHFWEKEGCAYLKTDVLPLIITKLVKINLIKFTF